MSDVEALPVDRRDGPTLSCHAVVGSTTHRLVVAGEIDLVTVGDLTRFLEDGIAAAAPGDRMRIDLSGVRLCSAAGVRALVSTARRARERGVELRYRPHSPAVALALDICGHLELTGPVEGSSE
jgi:anti-anti-sigma factor